MPLFLTENDVSQILSTNVAIDAIEEAFNQMASGKAINTPRSRAATPTGILNVMSAVLPSFGVMGLKTYGVMKNNRLRFYVQLLSIDTGELVALIEASELGRIRTGAASAVATKYMSRDNASTIGIIGTGYQALAQLEAICLVRDITKIKMFSRSTTRRTERAREATSNLGIQTDAVGSAEECVRESDIVITVTSAVSPVLEGKWISPGTHINAAGANHWTRRELDRETIQRSNIIVTDNVEQAKIECGDLIYPIEHGYASWDQVHNLAEVVAGATFGRRKPTDITLFESQGLAIEDISVAIRVVENAKAHGIGKDIPI